LRNGDFAHRRPRFTRRPHRPRTSGRARA
jgi:hypothetical protein